MGVHAFVDEGLGHSSYLIDLGDGSAALVDPPRFPEAHESLANAAGLVVAWTIDTHSHADYVTGSPALAARGSTFIAPAASNLATPHLGIADDEVVALSSAVHLRALATPGHTPDHHAFVVEHRGRPVALFSGGSLMIGAVGRTDLCGPERAEPLAHEMFRSLRRFDGFPGEMAVYPTHGAGSFCSAPGALERTSTLARERATNTLFAMEDEDEFVATLLGGFGTFPGYFTRLPELNRMGPTRFDDVPSLPRLGVADVARHLDSGGIVVDVRPPDRFAEASVSGSIANTLRPVFASWLGWLIGQDVPIAFVLDRDQNRSELVRQCLDVGHERLIGELDGGVGAWADAGGDVSAVAYVASLDPTQSVIDVRQAIEFAAGHVPGARNIELGSFGAPGAVSDLLHNDHALSVMCGHGERAMTAASLLMRRADGLQRMPQLTVFNGGPDTWATASGLPLVIGP